MLWAASNAWSDSPAARAGTPAPLAGILACRDIVEPTQRLACFDREVATVVSMPAFPSAATAHLTDPKETFGLPEATVAAREVAAGTRSPDAAKVSAHLTAVSQGADGRFVFTLDNGQVWRQLAAEGDTLAKPGDAVLLTRGMLGSFWLELSSKRGCKVTRVR